jgi:serine/threonine-protein kinase
MGTAGYMSPEQWLSTRDVGPATDIWSLGVILFELLTGHNPFNRAQVMVIYQAIIGHSRPRLTELRPEAPAGLEPVIDRCLAKDPCARFPSARELAVALRPFGPSPHAESTPLGAGDPNVAEAPAGEAVRRRKPAGPSGADQLWAQILTDEALRPRRARSPRWMWIVVALFVAALVAAVVWTNRHALDAPAAPSTAGGPG